MCKQSPYKAIALLSGGLDSHLAAKLVKDQGVEVVGLHLLSPFGCATQIQKNADELGIRLIVRKKGEAYLDLVKNPRYGYGKNMNPCIDCRIFMFQLADIVRQDEGADFIVTGEVLGQRPMSQQRAAIELIERKSPLADRVVRPLSAHSFTPSLPEREGWVDRSQFLSIAGRGRTRQLHLAKEFGFTTYSAPGGGCLLTDPSFSARLRDFFKYETTSPQAADVRERRAALLRVGRHFRLSDLSRLIVARNEKENAELVGNWKESRGTFFFPANFDGPNAILFGPVGEKEQNMTGGLIARYGRCDDIREKKIGYQTDKNRGDFIVLDPMSDEQLNTLRT